MYRDPDHDAQGRLQPRFLLKEEAYETIKSRILSGEYMPGDKLSERILGQSLGMSKTPVKAALERLEEQGLIELAPRRSACVKQLTVQEIKDHYEIRMALEAHLARMVTGRLEPSSVKRLTMVLEQQRSALELTSLADWAEADFRFHLTIAEIGMNQLIVNAMRRLGDQAQWLVVGMSRMDSTIPANAFLEHARILECLQGDDREEAVEAVELHLRNGMRFCVNGASYADPPIPRIC